MCHNNAPMLVGLRFWHVSIDLSLSLAKISSVSLYLLLCTNGFADKRVPEHVSLIFRFQLNDDS